jgi:hypothetical protein
MKLKKIIIFFFLIVFLSSFFMFYACISLQNMQKYIAIHFFSLILGCQSGAGDEIKHLSVLRSRVRFPVGPIPHLIEKVTLFYVSFHWGLQFPPTLHHKSPNMVYRANNVLVNPIFKQFHDIQPHIRQILPPTQAFFTRQQKCSKPPGVLTTWRHTFSVAALTHPRPDDRLS